MKLTKTTVMILLLAFTAVAYSAEGVFDRTAEVYKYAALINDGDRGQLVLVAREIYGSGISDQRLATAIYDRLHRDGKHISGSRLDEQYGVFMVKALASTGLESVKPQLREIHSEVSSAKTASACADELKQVDWHAQRDAVMASTANHHEGDDANVSRLINLLKSDDVSFKHWAVERMNWDKVLDKRLMQVIASQVQAYVDRHGGSLSEEEDDTMANFVKLLGYSKDVQYRPLLVSVYNLKSVSSGVKRHAKYAMDKLY